MKERLLILLAAAVLLTAVTPVVFAVGWSSAYGGAAIALDAGTDADCHGSDHCGC